MNNNNLKISVVTVCYNAVDIIEKTIMSVLGQTYSGLEYVIIDGGSTDGTADIVRKYADRLAYWVSEPDKGIFDAMNKGIAAATGDYINFMNAGDMFSSSTVLEEFVPRIDTDTTIAFGDWNVVSKDLVSSRKPLAMEYISRQIPFCHQAAFYRASYHKDHLFDTGFGLVGDYKIVYDAYKVYGAKFQYIPVTVADYDITLGESMSIDRYKEAQREKYRVWGIENDNIKRLPYEMGLLSTWLSYNVRKVLPSSTVMRIKEWKDRRRKHNG